MNISADTHEAFVLDKLVRTGVLAYAQREGGTVYACKLKGPELFPHLHSKLWEEIQEMMVELNRADRIPHLIEELGDIQEVITLMWEQKAPNVHDIQMRFNAWYPQHAKAQDILTSIAAKQAKNGKLEGWYAEVIVLPRTNVRWLPYYQTRYPTCPIADLTTKKPLPADTFSALAPSCT